MKEQRKTAEEAARRTKDRVQKSQEKYGQKRVSEVVLFSSVERLKMLADNEIGDARLIVKALKGKFCFDKQRNQVFFFREHWHEDILEEVFQEANRGVVSQYQEEMSLQLKIKYDQNRTKEERDMAATHEARLRRRIKTLNGMTRMRNVIKLASKGAGSLAITGDEWNLDHYSLQTKNALVDLRTGESRPGRPEDYINKASQVEWHGLHSDAPTWETAFREIFNTDEGAHYFQKVLGASLIGKPLQKFFILLGEGANGKSTILETTKKVLGPLAGAVSPEMIMGYRPKGGGADPELLDLQGKRLVWTSETKDGAKLNIETVKQFTGNDTLKGRLNYSNAIVEFIPQFSLFLLTNNAPVIQDNGYATWRRIELIPFSNCFVDTPTKDNEKAKIPDLEVKLESELPGVLAWLVRGCLAYQEEGLVPPSEIRLATKQYRDQEDRLQRFINERCAPTGKVTAGAFRAAYSEWLKKEYGHLTRVPSFAKIKEAMVNKQYEHDGNSRHSFFVGISVNEGP